MALRPLRTLPRNEAARLGGVRRRHAAAILKGLATNLPKSSGILRESMQLVHVVNLVHLCAEF